MRRKTSSSCTLVASSIWLISSLFICVAPTFAHEPLTDSNTASTSQSTQVIRNLEQNAPKDTWELAQKNAHPVAAKLMKDSFYWSDVDDDSPFGNDNGADALRLYQQWRLQNTGAKPIQFIEDLLVGWKAPLSKWRSLPPDTAGSVLYAGNGYVIALETRR
jgi:hypothetical protein